MKVKGIISALPTRRTFNRFAKQVRCFSGSPKTTDFGFQEVNAAEKERLVKGVFTSVASKYDVMNDLMSFGTHRLWKDEFVSMMGLSAAAKVDPTYVPRHLDVAGGTGDIAFRSALIMADAYKNSVQENLRSQQWNNVDNKPIIVCDINPDMLAVGKQRAASQIGSDKTSMVCLISCYIFYSEGLIMIIIHCSWILLREMLKSCPFLTIVLIFILSLLG